MTGDDELRARLSRIDPMRAGGAADPLPSLTAAEIQERTMQTIESGLDTSDPDHSIAPWHRPRVLAAAAALVLVLVAGAVYATTGDDPAPLSKEPTTLALSLPETGTVSGSCVQFEVAFLREMPIAFAGTVTDISADTVTMAVTRWYKGGSAHQVTVGLASGQTSAALDGVDFVEGNPYLVAAANGTVNGCGFSGPASPELERAYDEAFPR